ncbi:MAG: Mammalian cell entry related domain protein [Solirubrobacterales bacterium]|nr:Mammalian cell entry related domain protein [Solirubrobacterales bacterium]
MRPHVRQRMTHSLSADRLRLEARRSKKSALVLLVGVILGATAIGTVFHNAHIRMPWQSADKIQIAVADATGVLPKQNEVRISGLRVGTITGSRLQGDHAVLTLDIDPKYAPIYHDADIRLRPQTPLADMYVDIVNRGTKASGKLTSGQVLAASQTRGNVDVGAVLNTFNADTRSRMTTLINQLGTGLSNNGEHLKVAFVELFPFLQSAKRLTHQTATRGRITRALVHNLRLLTDELGSRDQQLTALVRDGSTTVSQIGNNRASLTSIIAQLPTTFGQLQRTLSTVRGTLDTVDPALVALRPAARALAPGLAALQDIATGGTPALGALQAPIRDLQPLVQDLRPTSVSLRRAVSDLRPQVPQLDRITRRIVPCELAVQKFFQWTPSVFKFSDANGIFPRGEGVVGTEVAGGTIHDQNLTRGSSCADGSR